MEPISNADRLILLLRQKLQERARSGATSVGSRPAAKVPDTPTGIRALTAVEGSDEAPLRRALIQNLIADQLGSEFINDAQFQQIVSRVTETIEEDPDTAQLLTRLIAELRES